MATNHLKSGVNLASETSYISNIRQITYNVQHNISLTLIDYGYCEVLY